MNFFQAIQSGFTNYTNFRGRAIRSEHNYWFLFAVIIGAISESFDSIIAYNEHYYFNPISNISQVVLFLPGVAVMVRRFHDINKSGWNYFWCLTVIGVIPVCYWLFIKEGNEDKNLYGENILNRGLDSLDENNGFDNISKLEKLASLKERGHITNEEYNNKKKELL